MDAEQLEIVRTGRGFFAALDQSGGSTPKALREYGLSEADWSSEQEMFDLVQQMRARILTSPAFGSDRVLAVILFEGRWTARSTASAPRPTCGSASASSRWSRSTRGSRTSRTASS